jgi:hypothetical protein
MVNDEKCMELTKREERKRQIRHEWSWRGLSWMGGLGGMLLQIYGSSGVKN